MMLALYRAAATAGGPFVRLYLRRRRGLGKEDPARFEERMGRPGLARPDAPLLWMHGASVGESLSLLPLIGRVREERPAVAVLVTTGTVSSARLMAERLPPGVMHQYVPVDRPAWVRRFLDHWRPDLAIWAESEFWPVMLDEARRRGLPMVLVQGRVSDLSFACWKRVRGLIHRILASFSLCLAQSDEDADRLRALGARLAVFRGNLKFVAPPLPVDAGELERLRVLLGTRPRWLAASTHPGEEAAAAAAHRMLAAAHPRLLTLIVPRHPVRGEEIAAALRADGITVARRGAGEPVTAETEVYLADTLGELGLFYRLAGIAFVGRSLTAGGGQNPIEPARLDNAILFGPRMENFREAAAGLLAAGAAEQVAGADALGRAVGRLLADPDEQARRAGAARAVAAAEGDTLDQVLSELSPFLDALAPATRTA